MTGHDWNGGDDDAGHASAVARTWITVVISLACVVFVVGAIVAVGLAIFGLSGMLAVVGD
ncbi:hypothetical protein ACIRPT_10380 [Streptomyces sp. NPDC101227]|uniref:hypothetical protein n=1 Tax=Streptomyces sp. NPDC101227 TaxID=3366136 RepID=UPI0038064C0F